MRERLIDKSVHRVTEFVSAERFIQSDHVPPGISTIYEGGLPIDILVSPATSPTTIVFFHGAIERHFTLPVLSGLGISGGLEANRVFISDPSLVLDETLLLAWYAGNAKQPHLQSTLTRILKKIVSGLGSERVVFFGGSGGGFASLFFASHFDNSLAVAFNPQTNIEKYMARAVGDFAEKAFRIPRNQARPLTSLPESVTYDLADLYTKPRPVEIAYLQNLNDTHHVESHLRPFSQRVHPDTKFSLLLEPWNEGHTPPPKDLLSNILNLSASAACWSTGLAEVGFEKLRTSL